MIRGRLGSVTLDIAADWSEGFGRNALTAGCNRREPERPQGDVEQDACREAADRGTAQEMSKGMWQQDQTNNAARGGSVCTLCYMQPPIVGNL